MRSSLFVSGLQAKSDVLKKILVKEWNQGVIYTRTKYKIDLGI